MTLAYNFTVPMPIPNGGPFPDSTNVSAITGRTGNGGRSLLGDGGSGSLASGSGTNNNSNPDFAINARQGSGYGAGASGQFNQGGTPTTGANGTSGIVIVEEFY